jgi:NADH-quinone oxidoreductase subunit M
VAILAERTGSEDLREIGGYAMRAPVFAALFLIVALATLAMPGSANFIGELFILNALVDSKMAYAFVASIGVVLAAYYALRLYQRTMHNRPPMGTEPREIGLGDGAVIGSFVAVILALALYPQVILNKTDEAASASVAAFAEPGEPLTGVRE